MKTAAQKRIDRASDELARAALDLALSQNRDFEHGETQAERDAETRARKVKLERKAISYARAVMQAISMIALMVVAWGCTATNPDYGAADVANAPDLAWTIPVAPDLAEAPTLDLGEVVSPDLAEAPTLDMGRVGADLAQAPDLWTCTPKGGECRDGISPKCCTKNCVQTLGGMRCE